MTPPVRRHRALAGGGFTLVELVTAAALMSVVMLGLVEIFRNVTVTAARAEALAYAQQQMRGVFDHLNRDLRGLSREGYLQIAVDAPPGGDANYRSNMLAFVSLGAWRGMQWQKNVNETEGAAAEVVYTTNVRTPTEFLRLYTSTTKEDYRRGVLGRGVWVLCGTPGAATDLQDMSAAGFLAELFCAPSLRRPIKGTYLVVYPWMAERGTLEKPETLRRVMASCASEFFVEYWDDQAQAWKNENKTFAVGSPVWPKAIRVTLAVHDPDDTAPLPSGQSRFRGYALQEVFWLGDP